MKFKVGDLVTLNCQTSYMRGLGLYRGDIHRIISVYHSHIYTDKGKSIGCKPQELTIYTPFVPLPIDIIFSH